MTYRPETLVVHAGQEPDPSTGAVMPPIVLASTFAQDSPGVDRGFDYSRAGNPTRDRLERGLAALEGATYGLAFASGCAAMNAVFQTLGPRDRILACDDVYGGTYRLLQQIFVPLGIEVSWVDMTKAKAVERELDRGCKLVWIETPTNPLLKVIDIAAVCATAKARGALVAVDNTFATPLLQRPLELGADLVIHSTTKYLNGHSDVVGGFVATSDAELADRLRFVQKATGGVPSPFDCYLVLRGLKTLSVRLERQCTTAEQLASWLARHEQVAHVHYPGLESHPQHGLAARQMRRPGAMISFVLKGGLDAAKRALETTRIFTLAESLGGVESLIEHPAMMTHGSMPEEVRASLGISDGLIRASVGLEAADDLQQDLERALA